MPVCLVKLSAVNCWRSTICGLFTIRTLMLLAPPPPPPAPQPAHPPNRARTSGTTRTRPREGFRATTGHLRVGHEVLRRRAHLSEGFLRCQFRHKGGSRQYHLPQWAAERSDERRCTHEPSGPTAGAGAADPHGVGCPSLLPRRPVQGGDRRRVPAEPVQ